MEDECTASNSSLDSNGVSREIGKQQEKKEDKKESTGAFMLPDVKSTINANEIELKYKLLDAGKKFKSLEIKFDILSVELKEAKQAELSAREEISKMEFNLESFRTYMARLESELDFSKELVKSGREERQMLLDTVTILNERIENLRRQNLELEYEKELSPEPNKEEIELREMKAETSINAAKMQATNWRKRYDEIFDQLAEKEKKHKQEIESRNELSSCFNAKLDDAFKQTLSLQNDLTICKMRNVILEKEKAGLIEECQRSTKLSSKAIQSEHCEKELEILKKEKNELTTAKSNLTSELNESRRRITYLENTAQEMKLVKSRSDEFEKIVDNMRQKKEELEEAKLRLMEDLNEARKKLGEIESNAESMKRRGLRCEELDNNMRELRKEKEDLVISKSELIRDLDKARKRLEQMERHAESTVESNMRCEELKKKIKQLNGRNGELLTAESVLTRDLNIMREKYEEMERKSVSQGVRCEELEKDVERVNVEKEELEDARLMLLRNLEDSQKKTAEMTRQYESTKEDFDALQLQSKVLEKGMKKLRKENAVFLNAKKETAPEEARKKLEKMEKSVHDSRTNMTSIKTEILKLSEEKKQVDEKLDYVYTLLDRANRKVEDMKREKAEMVKNCSQREVDLTMYRSRCDELEKEIGHFNDANEELIKANNQSMSAKYRKRCERLEKQVDELNERLEETKSTELSNEKILALETEKNECKRRLDEAQLLMGIATVKIGELQRGKDELTRKAILSESELLAHGNGYTELEKENGNLEERLNKAESWIGEFTALSEQMAEMEKFVFFKSSRTSIEEMRVLEMERDQLVLRLKETERQLNMVMEEIKELKKMGAKFSILDKLEKSLDGTELA